MFLLPSTFPKLLLTFFRQLARKLLRLRLLAC